MAKNRTIKFHGQEVRDIIVRYMQTERGKSRVVEFDAVQDPEECESINVQVVSEFVTITFYKDEKANSIIKRNLVPTHQVERIEVQDL